jgi:microcompartment protein CcmL/EutN
VDPALLLLELGSIAHGIRVADVMAKASPLPRLVCGTVHPGKYLILATGGVGEVEEARRAALEAAGGHLLAEVFLPAVHKALAAALLGQRRPPRGEAVAIVETARVPPLLDYVDAALKGARVTLMNLGLADGLGGKGYALLTGEVHDVEAALEVGVERLGGVEPLVAQVILSQFDQQLMANLLQPGPFFHHSELRGEQ